MKSKFLSELVKRISSESPALFKKLQWLFFTLAALVGFVAFFDLQLPSFWAKLMPYMNLETVSVLLGFGGISILPVEDGSKLK